MEAIQGHRRGIGVGALALTILVMVGAPSARAHVGVFVGGSWGYPGPYRYYPYYSYVPYPYDAYPSYPWVAPPAVPPPGWVPGHWERRYDARGRYINVWIPEHLR
jgi:hypothetical protein